ncbi:MAG: leucyl/phenylalanyl-tRNA--protein transferase [Bacteroidota bacterium]
MPLYYIIDDVFPNPEKADKNGILAIGGNFSPELILKAYKKGIFHWFNESELPVWYSPNPRMVLYPKDIKISKSMKQLINQNTFICTIDQAFNEVINQCRNTRIDEGTWISDDIIDIYNILHLQGFAHSIEVWQNNNLVGGLYGVALGKCFMGESMFNTVSNASKMAMIYLSQYLEKFQFKMIDCQVANPHLLNLGAVNITRKQFLKDLAENIDEPTNAFNKNDCT